MDIQTNTFIVDSPEFARSMLNIDDWKRLALFMNETTLSEVADKLDISLSKLSYHVNKWLEYNIIEVVREEKRAGRPVKIYKTTNQRFFIPFHLTPSASLEDLLVAMTRDVHEIAMRETAHTLKKAGDNWGILWEAAEESGAIRGSPSPYPGSSTQTLLEQLETEDGPISHFNFAKLKLDFPTAKALQKELLALHEKYQDLQQEKQQSYLLQLGITSLRPGTKMA